MKCERCGENPGEIRYTEYTNGVANKQLICARCAETLGFGSGEVSPGGGAEVFDPEEAVDTLFGAALLVGAVADDTRCPECGLRAVELRNTSLLGCPKCYEVYADVLRATLEHLHGAEQHRGRLPGQTGGGTAPGGGGAA